MNKFFKELLDDNQLGSDISYILVEKRLTTHIGCTVQEEFEGTKGVIIIRKSKNRQHNGQKKNYKKTNNDL